MSIEFQKPASPLAGINDTQTFKNKTLDNNTLRIQDSSDPTKFAHFDMSGLPTGTDSVISLSSAGGVAPANVTALSATEVINNALTLKWTDPNDVIVDGVTLVAWAGTKIVRKTGSYPTNENDGTLVVNSVVRNAYSSTGFSDSGLTGGTLYYYQAFPYSSTGATNRNTANRVSATVITVYVYGVRIDTTNSNPSTAVTYTDDAVGMTGGSATWDTMFPFNAIKPCVLLNGVVQYYLNPNNYAQKADLSASNITSGSDGDVMIEIPKMAYLINTTGNYVDVKITNNPNAKSVDANYCFFAHSRASEGDKNNLYVGAYAGNTSSSKLRSLSGKAPTASQTIGTFRTQAQANGTGYDQLGFYPLTLLQCLYLIRYKNLDSQTALGRGYVDANASAINTGGTNAKGMNFGEGTGKLQMKFLGIEDFWGNVCNWIDGLFCDGSRNILTAFTSFNNTGSGYSNKGTGGAANLGGYMSKPQGNSNTGFIVKEVSGSSTTYYTDYAYLYAGSLPVFGGAWTYASSAGAFRLDVTYSASYSDAYIGGRLMFL